MLFFRRRLISPVLASLSILGAAAQQEQHGRGYKAPPPTADITVTVQKGFNQKPLPNASVIFRAERDGKLTGNLETKTDPDGRASLDLLEVGSHITIQVIANGFATYATDFDLTADGKQILAKLQRPRAQVSQYQDNTDKPAAVEPGIQEHQLPPADKTLPAPSGQAAPALPTTQQGAQAPASAPETTAPPPVAKPDSPQ